MKLTLPRFGSQEISVDSQSIISFPNGIPGFEDIKRYALLHEGENPVVYYLQALDDPEVVFSLADPSTLNINYEMTLSDDEQQALEMGNGDEVSLALLLSKKDGAGGVQVHMECPIIINASKRKAIQKALPTANLDLSIRA